MASFFSGISGIFGGVMSSLKYVLYALPFIILIVSVIVHYKNKQVYKYKVRVFKERENGKVKENNWVGGYIGRVNSAPFFRIRTGWWWWQYLDFIETPKIKYMDEDDRVYYKQIDINTFIQLKRAFINNKIMFTPVESDVKYGAILSVQRIKEVLRTEPTWKKVLPYLGLVLMAIVFIVAYAMLMNQCGG